jgi:basic membrane protein A and related proteins
VKGKRWIAAAIATLLVVSAAVAAGYASTGSAASKSKLTASLISDTGKFNDRSFNQSQLEGFLRAKKQFGITAIPLQSNSSSDYLPNLTTAIRRHASLVMAAGFLLAPSLGTVAQKFPKVNFTITDDSVKGPDFKGKSVKNIEGLTYASNQGGCLVGYLAGLMAKKKGGKQVISAVGGLNIPPVNNYIVGYKYCAKLANPKIKVLVGYSQDFVAQDKCKTIAVNQIAQGAQIIFPVAGGCGLGAMSAADDAKLWSIGVDKDQYKDAKRVLTSAVKRVDVGIFSAVQQAVNGKFKGGTDLVFNLKNKGISVGRISASVPKAYVAKMNVLKSKIIAGKVKVPSA